MTISTQECHAVCHREALGLASCGMQVREDNASDLKRGTRITLHLKQDAKDLADAQKLEQPDQAVQRVHPVPDQALGRARLSTIRCTHPTSHAFCMARSAFQ